MLDFIIVAAIAVAFALCVRSLRKGSGGCSGCAQEGTCAAHATGKGKCPVAQDMVAKANEALGDSSRRG
ncbi:hypothetical protein [Parafannyhessea umbonata]|uniref:FeoB-associated Cys-rich membrane protein n=1 Tax=Parafannyhessea umbonata TaxID=604330 RepID=A0A1H1M6N8_9ACTN|nr:hypothetical protein [Parafannyhessea umbonata]MST60340.1 FeoB-associated Cys-rich membrane protein [Parafannyhessea umbonata]SDR82065.1 hypothetical protein SAMN04489857_1298 [Parafannyhessea umbonata]